MFVVFSVRFLGRVLLFLFLYTPTFLRAIELAYMSLSVRSNYDYCAVVALALAPPNEVQMPPFFLTVISLVDCKTLLFAHCYPWTYPVLCAYSIFCQK